MNRDAIVALEDGSIFRGKCFGRRGEKTGEVVFNTSMYGYQEILTDPSYKGQIVAMTYPMIGNYGVNFDDNESDKPKVEGFIVKELSTVYSNWRARGSLDDFLEKHGIIGIEGIDTRALTRHLRIAGAMKGIISTDDLEPDSLIEKARLSPCLVGCDLVREATCQQVHRPVFSGGEKTFAVSAIDCGMKTSILKKLDERGCRLTVFPATASPEEIRRSNPDGIFISNGPGDPEGVPYLIETVRKLLGYKPVFGICLGHQIIGLALGGGTYKLKFGHRGGNHPVMDLKTGKIDITAQNHGFCVDGNTLDQKEVELTHINLYDKTLEGLKHKEMPLFSVQYHPEASPGPHDAVHLFDRFVSMMKNCH